MKDPVPGIIATTFLGPLFVMGIIFGCTREPVSLPEKKVQKTIEAPPASFLRWRRNFYGDREDAYQWICRKTTEGEPKGHYCTIEGDLGHMWTLYCSERHCDLVTLVHEAKWSKTIPNPGFSAPIFSRGHSQQ